MVFAAAVLNYVCFLRGTEVLQPVSAAWDFFIFFCFVNFVQIGAGRKYALKYFD